MAENVKPIPDGYTAVTPHLVVEGAVAAIEFYKKAFGAEEVMRLPAPDGTRLLHAEVRIGGAVVMLADAFPEWGSRSPMELGGTTAAVHLYVEDADAVFAKALEAGATETMALQDMFWGDRYGKLLDPFGHAWSVSTHVKDPTPEELETGMKAAMSGEAGPENT